MLKNKPLKKPDQNTIRWVQALQKDKNKQIVIVPHINPDGDAIGASMALYSYFSKTNTTTVISPSSLPDFLEWMPNSKTIINFKKDNSIAQSILSKADLIIILDHNAADRSGGLEPIIEKSEAKKLMIDHHPDPTYPVDFKISNIQVSSTSELVYNFISAINTTPLDQEIASAIYVGIMTDTGNFMHNIHEETFAIVSHLMNLKIDREAIYDQVFNNYSEDRMRLLGYALSDKMEVIKELGVAILSLDKIELQKFNFQIGDTEGFVNMPLAIKGINISILVLEREKEIKISFRSKGEIAINTIAKNHFNGGGHKNAAGGSENNLTVVKTVEKLKSILFHNKTLLNYEE